MIYEVLEAKQPDPDDYSYVRFKVVPQSEGNFEVLVRTKAGDIHPKVYQGAP